MRWMGFLALVFVASGCSGGVIDCCTEPPTPIRTSPDTGCDATTFFVEMSPTAETPAATFKTELENQLNAKMPRAWCTWQRLTGTTPPGCALSGNTNASVEVTQVFGARPGTVTPGCFEHDGDLRFFRVAFKNAGAPSAVPTEAMCTALGLVRTTANAVIQTVGSSTRPLCRATAARLGDPNGGIRVGRECFATAQSRSRPSADRLFINSTPNADDWHRRRLGVEASNPVTPAGNRVDLVLVDTGLGTATDPAVTRLTESSANPKALFPDATAAHPQGQIMAMLAKPLAPDAKLTSIRVADGTGRAPTSALARGIEAAVFDTSRPHVISVGLAWEPQHSRPHAVEGPKPRVGFGRRPRQCVEDEDAVGGAVRFALGLAHLDPRPDGPSLAVAPTGGRSLVRARNASPTSSFDRQMAYPAAWTLNENVVDPWTQEAVRIALTLAPGTVDWTDRRTLNTRPEHRRWLEAPGEHIKPTNGWTEDPWTGSALASGQVAAILAQARAWRGASTAPIELYELTYRTGDAITSDDRFVAPRRPNLCRLKECVNTPFCGTTACPAVPTVRRGNYGGPGPKICTTCPLPNAVNGGFESTNDPYALSFRLVFANMSLLRATDQILLARINLTLQDNPKIVTRVDVEPDSGAWSKTDTVDVTIDTYPTPIGAADWPSGPPTNFDYQKAPRGQVELVIQAPTSPSAATCRPDGTNRWVCRNRLKFE